MAFLRQKSFWCRWSHPQCAQYATAVHLVLMSVPLYVLIMWFLNHILHYESEKDRNTLLQILYFMTTKAFKSNLPPLSYILFSSYLVRQYEVVMNIQHIDHLLLSI